MKNLLLVVAVVGLTSCTPFERQGALNDFGSYVGAPAHPDGSFDRNPDGTPRLDGQPDYDPKEVAVAAAQQAAQRAGDPVGLAAWAAVAGVVVATGWFKRKFLVEAAKGLAGAIKGAGEEKETKDE